MTVYTLCNLYIEGGETMRIYDISSNETVFEGPFDEAKYSDYSDHEVQTFGIEGDTLVINIDSEDE